MTTAQTWWRHQMETFSALLDICAGNSLVTGEFPSQRPVTRSFDVFFDLHLDKRLSKQSWGWWFETPSCPLWRHCNDLTDLSLNVGYRFYSPSNGHQGDMPFCKRPPRTHRETATRTYKQSLNDSVVITYLIRSKMKSCCVVILGRSSSLGSRYID